MVCWVAALAGCQRPDPSPQAPAPASAVPAEAASPIPPSASTAAPAATAPPSAPQADAVASAGSPATATATASLPQAVITFQQRRDECDHLRGEEPYDKQRAAFLKAALAKACKGSDKALAALRKRFAQHPEALAALKPYQDRIE